MKRFLIYLALVFLAIICVMCAYDELNRALVMSSACTDIYKMKRLFESTQDNEIPVLGSSRAEVCFAPSELSSDAFSYGQGGSLFRETVFQLKFILKGGGGRLIIVNLDPWGLHAGAFRCDYRFVSDVQEVKNEPNIVMPWHVRMPGFRFYGELRKNLAMGIRSDISSKVMDRGAVLSKIVRSERDWDYIMQNLEMKSFAVDAETKIMLRDVLLENENREVVFVVAPIVDAWWEKFAAKAEFEELKSWIRNFKHAHVIDWRELGDRYDLSCYFDPTHLNEKGARAFTKALKSSLMSRGLLKKECSQ